MRSSSPFTSCQDQWRDRKGTHGGSTRRSYSSRHESFRVVGPGRRCGRRDRRPRPAASGSSPSSTGGPSGRQGLEQSGVAEHDAHRRLGARGGVLLDGDRRDAVHVAGLHLTALAVDDDLARAANLDGQSRRVPPRRSGRLARTKRLDGHLDAGGQAGRRPRPADARPACGGGRCPAGMRPGGRRRRSRWPPAAWPRAPSRSAPARRRPAMRAGAARSARDPPWRQGKGTPNRHYHRGWQPPA